MPIDIPYDCPRGRKDCIALSNIVADSGESFFCCGENDGTGRKVEGDKFTVCFKGEHDDRLAHYDKRDLVHQASTLVVSLAVIERFEDDEEDWSPWTDLKS